MREFRRLPKAAISRVEHPQGRTHNRIHNSCRNASITPRRRFRLRDRALDHLCLLDDVFMFFFVCRGNAGEHALETWPAISVVRRKIGAAVKRLAVRSKKRGQRPSALAAHSAHGSLIPAVDIRPLIAIDLHRDEMFVHNRGNFRIIVGLAIHDVAPVAPHRANIEQHRLVLALRRAKGFLTPLMPMNRLVHRRSQVRG